jgi:hypothetical protein
VRGVSVVSSPRARPRRRGRVTRLSVDDLPADVRARVAEAAGRPARRRSTRREVPAAEGGLPLRCARCGETFVSSRAAERHVNGEHGGGRVECVLG